MIIKDARNTRGCTARWLPSHLRVSGEYGHRKRNFSKTLLRVWSFWKRRFPMFVWTDENGTFQKRLRHGMLSNARFKIADVRIHFVSPLHRLFWSLIACLDINSALLNAHADYVRRRLNIIRLLSLPISKASLKCLDKGWRRTRSSGF